MEWLAHQNAYASRINWREYGVRKSEESELLQSRLVPVIVYAPAFPLQDLGLDVALRRLPGVRHQSVLEALACVDPKILKGCEPRCLINEGENG